MELNEVILDELEHYVHISDPAIKSSSNPKIKQRVAIAELKMNNLSYLVEEMLPDLKQRKEIYAQILGHTLRSAFFENNCVKRCVSCENNITGIDAEGQIQSMCKKEIDYSTPVCAQYTKNKSSAENQERLIDNCYDRFMKNVKDFYKEKFGEEFKVDILKEI